MKLFAQVRFTWRWFWGRLAEIREDLLTHFRFGENVTIQWGACLIGAGIQIGVGSRVEKGAMLITSQKNPRERVVLGQRNIIRVGAKIYSCGGFVEIGDDCSVNPNTVIYGTGGIRIGNGVRIAANTVIVASMHVFDDPEIPIYKQGYTAKGITIEDDVWIGAGVTILDGVRIGRGAVIGAGAVVRSEVSPLEIVAGVPARHIRFRGQILPLKESSNGRS